MPLTLTIGNPVRSPPTERWLQLWSMLIPSWFGTRSQEAKKLVGNTSAEPFTSHSHPTAAMYSVAGTIKRRFGQCGQWETPNLVMGSSRLAAFSPDNGTLAIVPRPAVARDIQFFDLKTRNTKRTQEFAFPVLDIAYSQDGSKLAVVCDNSHGTGIGIFNPDTGAWLGNLPGKGSKPSHVSFSADNAMLAAAMPDGRLNIWNLEFEELGSAFQGAINQVSQAAFSPDGGSLATSTDEGSIRLWNTALLSPSELIKVSAACRGPVVFSPDGQRVAVVNCDRSVVLVNIQSGRTEVRLVGHLDRVEDIAFSPDGLRLATSDLRHICCWDTMDGRRLWRTDGVGVRSIAWSPIDPILASGGNDHRVRLWDAATGKETGVLEGHAREISMVRFFPGGQRLASASYDTTIRIWDVATQQAVDSPISNYDAVHQLAGAYSSDGCVGQLPCTMVS